MPDPAAPFSHTPQSELSMLLQAMLIRELRDLREGGDKLDELKFLIVSQHKALMSNIDAEAKELRGLIKEIASEPDQSALVTKLKTLAAKLNAMAPVTPPTP